MKTFGRIYYGFDCQGRVDIEARSQKEAGEIFKNGDWVFSDEEWAYNHKIIEIAEEG